MSIVPALQTELAALESELRADPRWRKMERIRELLRDYEAVPTDYENTPLGNLFREAGNLAGRSQRQTKLPSQHGPQTAVEVQELWSRPVVFSKQPTKQERVKAEIRELLAQKPIAHRKDILAHLTARGVMGYEKDPMGSLAAYLSGFKDDFVFDGNGNYSLKPD